jgi:hypothetical protein
MVKKEVDSKGLNKMMGKSVFLKTFGDSPINKVLDFLIVFDSFDYSIADIAENSEVGYSTLKILIKDLVKRKIVVPTRISGKNKMYKLNKENSTVKSFVNFYWDITDQKVKKLVEEPMVA